jgi:HEAT repeat protein
LGRLLLLALPALFVAGAALRASGDRAALLWFGAAIELGACAFALVSGPGWYGAVDLAVIILYVGGFGWLVGDGTSPQDWYLHVARATLLVVPLGSFAAQFLRESGAPALRQARILASRLERRRRWPADLDACRLVSQVADLREALHIDASPALALLSDPRPQVRIAALAALEYRQNWRSGQTDPVMRLAQGAAEPEIRAAAVRALANLTEREPLESLAEALHDSSLRVRRAAAEALLGGSEANWAWVRAAARRALADPNFQSDGSLCSDEVELGPEAINDLTAWAAEKGLLGLRAAQTLADHYSRQLAAGPDDALLARLRVKVEDVHAPPMLRLELARLVLQHVGLSVNVLRNLVSPSTPAPLRLLAVEALLAAGEAGQALAALYDLGRLPNREIALAVAEVAQRRLGINFGLPPDQPSLPVQSRLAAEVARRVLAWATQQDLDDVPMPEVGSGTTKHI